ncbi:MAG: MATE family efflux transporter [Acidobacteriota bacterium]|jgi:MATE family multidrug resistance protein|nr:MATE family efflux transporter [Acidobacteriota bacterium]
MIPATSKLVRVILGTAWPVLVAQLVSIGMMVVDTLVVGRYSTRHLAAVAVGSGIYVALAMGLGGVLQALAPVVGQSYGAGQTEKIGFALRQGLWLALALAVGGGALLAAPGWLLAPAHLEPDVEEIAVCYMRVLALSLPASLGYRAFHATATALGQPHPLMVVAFLETLGHAVLASCLVGGRLGLPELGAAGAALSQVAVSFISLALCFWLLLKSPRFAPFRVFAHWERPSWPVQKEFLRLGIPIGMSFLVEISAFTLMAIFIARLGAETVGGHRIAANLSALVYMLPLALAIATAAQVAQSVGAGNERQARAYAFTGLKIACVCAVSMVAVLLWLRAPIAWLATDDPRVAETAIALAFYIALYQFFDAVQTIACFSLRGYKISFVPLLVHLACFWGLGLGLGYWLAFNDRAPQGAAGFWQAAVASTVTAALSFGGLLWRVTKRRALREPHPCP